MGGNNAACVVRTRGENTCAKIGGRGNGKNALQYDLGGKCLQMQICLPRKMLDLTFLYFTFFAVAFLFWILHAIGPYWSIFCDGSTNEAMVETQVRFRVEEPRGVVEERSGDGGAPPEDRLPHSRPPARPRAISLEKNHCHRITE